MHTQKLDLKTLLKELHNVSKDSRWKSEKDKLICPESKTFTLPRKVPPVKWIAVLKTMIKNSLKVRFFGQNLKTTKKIFLLLTIFLKTFLRGRWIQFWKSYRKCIAHTQKLTEKLFWKDCFSKEHSPGRSNFSFDNATVKNSPVGRNIFTERPKKIK